MSRPRQLFMAVWKDGSETPIMFKDTATPPLDKLFICCTTKKRVVECALEQYPNNIKSDFAVVQYLAAPVQRQGGA